MDRHPPDDLQHAYSLWNASAYSDLKLAGYLANKVQPWAFSAPR
ncbi:hypothetical protein [Arthrobacter sp. Y81]|nr:hypothetical protein [Arthrobacter sp. Y81]